MSTLPCLALSTPGVRGAPTTAAQVAALLSSLHINPAALPGELPHAHDAAWNDVWRGAAAHHPPEPGALADMAAAAAELPAWEQFWQQQRWVGLAARGTPCR